MADSIMSDERECYVCGSPNVHKHHVYGGTGRRPISEREGCWVYLCPFHHNMSKNGVHFDHELDERIKMECQERWEELHDGDRDAFRRTFGQSYL